MSGTFLIETIRVDNILGEGVLWRESDSTCWWVDIEASRIYCLIWPGLDIKKYSLSGRVSALAFVRDDDEHVLVACEDRVCLFNTSTEELIPYSVLHGMGDKMRLNDGKVGPDGAFWIGAIDEVVSDAVSARACLYRIARPESDRPVLSSMRIVNGLEWAPNGKQMYLTDTPTGVVSRASFDPSVGRPGIFKPLSNVDKGYPDGAAVDDEGCYWSALWGAGCLIRMDETGNVIDEVKVPASQVTCLAFGGPNLDLIFVTSARHGLSKEELSLTPDAGALFIFQSEVRGLPARRADWKIPADTHAVCRN